MPDAAPCSCDGPVRLPLLACDGLALDGRPGLLCRIVTPPGSVGAPQGLAAVRPYGLPTDPDDPVRWGDFH